MRGSWTSRTTAAFALALTVAAGACGGDSVGPGEFTIADLEGTWTITRYEFTADASDDEFDLIGDGRTGRIVVTGNGNYTMTITAPGLSQTTTGTFTIDDEGNVVDSNATGDIVVNREGDTITIRDENAEFDFDEDDTTPEAAADLVAEWQLD